MTFMSVYNEEQRGFGPLRAPQTVSQAFPNIKPKLLHNVLFISKIMFAARSRVRSIAWSVLDRRVCDRSLVIVLEFHGAVG